MRDAPLSAAEDAVLAGRIAAAAPGRDAAAEAELCRRFGPRLRLYGLRHLRSEAAAADLAQDVLIIVLVKLRAGQVRDTERLGAFVLGTARQCAMDSRRGGARRERLLGTFPVDWQPLEAEDAEALDTVRLHDCLQRLAERERTVLLMSFYNDMAANAVGVELGLSAENVRVIRHRGIRRLRGCMDSGKELS
ncbi:MAG: RNA polymerase sigma factor [Steroidobacteraceae bacterium]